MKKNSTSISRIISASTASWVRIGLMTFLQLALTPIYLGSWSADSYGAWLLLQAVWSIITIIDLSHHDYVGYECLKTHENNHKIVTKIIFSAGPIALLIAVFDILLVSWLVNQSFAVSWIGGNIQLINEWKSALYFQAVTWLVTGSIGGLIVRGLTPFGYNPQFAWWGVLISVSTATIPAAVVFFWHASILGATIALCAVNLVCYIIFFIWSVRILLYENLWPKERLDFISGGLRGLNSTWLAAKNFIEIMRQQGSRIILAPLVGTVEMAAFTTMRTGANFALQGLNTIANPVMPELMRFLSIRDQQKIEGIFAIVWLVLCIFLAPSVILIQYLAPSLFPIWTRGKIEFDPWIFAALSLSVLIVALAQPANAIIQGKNRGKVQLFISIMSAIVAIGGMVILVPLYGLKSAAFSLLIAELINLVLAVYYSVEILQLDGLRWPWRAFKSTASSLAMSSTSLFLIAIFPEKFNIICLLIALIFQLFVAFWYWRCLPCIVRVRIMTILLSRFK